MPIKDYDPRMREAVSQQPDPQGQAALLLVESLIHGLIECRIISVDDAIEIVQTADDVQVEVAEAADGHGEPMWRSHALLSAIARSLSHDRDRNSPVLRPVS